MKEITLTDKADEIATKIIDRLKVELCPHRKEKGLIASFKLFRCPQDICLHETIAEEIRKEFS